MSVEPKVASSRERTRRRPAGPAATIRGRSRWWSRSRRSWRCSTPASPTSRCRTSPAACRSTVDESTWVLTSYLVSNAIVLPVSGWLAQLHRPQALLHDAASRSSPSARCLCGLAPTLPSLIFFRVLQGAGGGGLAARASRRSSPTRSRPKSAGWRSRSTAWRSCSRRRSARRSAASSPTTTHWRWIFFINVPVGIVVAAAQRRAWPRDPPHRAGAPRESGRSTTSASASSRSGWRAEGRARQGPATTDWFELAVHHRLLGAVRGRAHRAGVVGAARAVAPGVDVHLFRARNFAVSCAMMLRARAGALRLDGAAAPCSCRS